MKFQNLNDHFLHVDYFDAQEILSIIKTSDIGLKELKEMLAQYKKMDCAYSN